MEHTMRDDVAQSIVEEFWPRPARTLETCRALVAAGYTPYARMTVNGRELEVISRPFVQSGLAIHGGGAGIGIMVRVPDDPTTMVEWSIPRAAVRRAVERRTS